MENSPCPTLMGFAPLRNGLLASGLWEDLSLRWPWRTDSSHRALSPLLMWSWHLTPRPLP